mgnify:CR=1 FL=1
MTLSGLTKKDSGEEKWEAMMAQRLPQLLDEAIKRSRHLSLDDLCNNMDPNQVYQMLPMSFPVDPESTVYVAEECGWGEAPIQKKICGVVKYKIHEWRARGAPYITVNSWFKLMIVLGQGNPEMAEIVDIAESFEGADEETHKPNIKNLRKRRQARLDRGNKSQTKEDIANGNYEDLQCWTSLVQEEASKASSSKTTPSV